MVAVVAPGRRYARLTRDERMQIEVLWRQGCTVTQIAGLVERPVCTISREIKRNGSYRWLTSKNVSINPRSREMLPHRRGVYARCYGGWAAHRKACNRRTLTPRPVKLADPVLCAKVARLLADRMSPAQVSARLRRDHPDRAGWQVSHEAIYQALFLQGRGELRREVARQLRLRDALAEAALKPKDALRSGQTQRRPRRHKVAGVISGRGSRPWTAGWNISTRPAEAADRAVPGHWEGDLLIGVGGKSAIITCVERSSRYVLLGALPHGRDSAAVIEVLTVLISTLPEQLRRSLAWDQGVELAQVADFRIVTGCPVYFADPHSPWQRGSNENTNGLLRQYFPKGKHSFANTTQTDLDAVAAQLNRRPRMTLNWDTPAERLNQLLLALRG
jgi:IS30 family transposase